jgi:prepilin-type N-terminal cleavage/methylation domain-containing protein
MRRQAFSLVELLVAIAIILMLMAMMGAAVSATRGAQKKQATQALIGKLDTVMQRQWESYSARYVSTERLKEAPGVADIQDKAAARAWYLRRNIITADLPDRWTDVKFLSEHTDFLNPSPSGPILFPQSHLTAAQRAYIGIWRNFTQPQQQTVGTTFAGAECLFMIIMQGGVANCLECAGLKTADIGDKDNDGAPEFHDAWGNPIGYILWPAAVELPAGSGTKFFSGSRRLYPPIGGNGWSSHPVVESDGAVLVLTPALGMRPLIYSAGADGEYGYERSEEVSNLDSGSSPRGRDCGNWNAEPCRISGRPATGNGAQHVLDNLTNLDEEAKR